MKWKTKHLSQETEGHRSAGNDVSEHSGAVGRRGQGGESSAGSGEVGRTVFLSHRGLDWLGWVYTRPPAALPEVPLPPLQRLSNPGR